MKKILYLFTIIFILQSCIEVDNPYTKITPGIWRGTLKLNTQAITNEKREPTLESIGNLQMKSITEGELPFNFEVIYPTPDSFYIQIFNGDERIKLTDITYGLDRSTSFDTMTIDFPVYDSYLKIKVAGGTMQGDWVVNYRGEKPGAYKIPFVASYGDPDRFHILKSNNPINVDGHWEIEFLGDGGSDKALGIFNQEGHKVTGTIRTETGDYRYLEGAVENDKMYLSVFDGSHAFLFESKLLDDDEMIGTFASGKHYKVGWKAKRNNNFTLTDPNKLTFAEDKTAAIDLSFPDLEGNLVNLSDPKYDGKIKLIQILGTWCPNCRDETKFLVDYLEKNPSDDIVIFGIGYERYRDQQKGIAALKRYKDKMNIPYPILYGGYADKKATSEAFPMLNKIISYPTMIYIDKKNQIHKIHTGFNGPATDQYDDFKIDFNETINKLRNYN